MRMLAIVLIVFVVVMAVSLMIRLARAGWRNQNRDSGD